MYEEKGREAVISCHRIMNGTPIHDDLRQGDRHSGGGERFSCVRIRFPEGHTALRENKPQQKKNACCPAHTLEKAFHINGLICACYVEMGEEEDSYFPYHVHPLAARRPADPPDPVALAVADHAFSFGRPFPGFSG